MKTVWIIQCQSLTARSCGRLLEYSNFGDARRQAFELTVQDISIYTVWKPVPIQDVSELDRLRAAAKNT